MKERLSAFIIGMGMLCFTACAAGGAPAVSQTDTSLPETSSSMAGNSSTAVESTTPETNPSQTVSEQEEKEEEPVMKQNTFSVTVGGTTFTANFADNTGAQALKELLAQGPVTIDMRDYGGFEKVGNLGQNLPTSNSQTTTQEGDIVLYQGNQIVIFYGSNSWSYTRLGKIDDLTGWREALGSGDVSVTFSLAESQS